MRRAGAFAAGTLLIWLALGVGAPPATAQSYEDVTGSEWYGAAALALAAEMVIYPQADGTFGALEPVTRAELAVYLFRLLDLEPSTEAMPFTDVGPYDWYAYAVGALQRAGLVTGTSPTTFSPGLLVSRQQAATLVMRSLTYFAAREEQSGMPALGLVEDETAAWLGGFRDRELMAPAHIPSVANAYRLGIVQGSADGWFYPQSTITRAQLAVMLYRAFLQPLAPRQAYPVPLPAVTGYEKLSAGSQGPLVYLLESRLAALRYPCGDVDGVYDKRTRDAVMAFEKVERLTRDGVVGEAVWGRLFVAQTPRPRYLAAGSRVEVDLSRQVMFMITNDSVTEIVHVSTGKLGTPTGHGEVWLRQTGWQECSVGWMYYPCYFWPRIAIHGSSSVPPYPASHGCVRTPTWMSPHIYEQLLMSTGVDVYY